MSLDMFRKALLYSKDIQEVGLFATMTNSKWFVAFGGSPLYFVMLPLIGLLLTLMAIVNGYELAKASNKNFDKWFDFIISGLCATLASISLYGAVISTVLNIPFAIGPWFFLGSLVAAFVHQLTSFSLLIARAFQSPKDSSEQIHHLQKAFSSLYTLALLSAITGAVLFVMLTPIAGTLGASCAIAATALTAINILWRLTPPDWKLKFKRVLGLEKDVVLNHPKEKPQLKSVPLIEEIEEDHIVHHRLFQSLNFNISKDDLIRLINLKLPLLAKSGNEKNLQKIKVLTAVRSALTEGGGINKMTLFKENPLVFQSFWNETGEVERIVNAAITVNRLSKLKVVTEAKMNL